MEALYRGNNWCEKGGTVIYIMISLFGVPDGVSYYYYYEGNREWARR